MPPAGGGPEPMDAPLAQASTEPKEQSRPLKRRREDLFLGDAEQFAFDFGGPTVEPAEHAGEGGEGEDDDDDGSHEPALDEDTVAAVAAVGARRTFSLEEVKQLAADSYRIGPRRFLTIPKPQQRGASDASSANAAATLDEAVAVFQAGLRRYDEALWKADRERKTREKKRRTRT